MLHRENQKIWIGTSENGPVYLLPSMANRHGLIAGATGTGKTVSLKVLAEGFSERYQERPERHGITRRGDGRDQPQA